MSKRSIQDVLDVVDQRDKKNHKKNSNEISHEWRYTYEILQGTNSMKQFPEAILRLIAEYSILTAKCLVCGLHVRVNLNQKEWVSTRLDTVDFRPNETDWDTLAPREITECVWTTTKDLDRWYILNVNVQGIPGRLPRQRKYRNFPLAKTFQIICGCCAWEDLTLTRLKIAKAKRRKGRKSDIEWIRFMHFLIAHVRRGNKEFTKKMAQYSKQGKMLTNKKQNHWN